MRPWEIARLTDHTIDNLIRAQSRYSERVKKMMKQSSPGGVGEPTPTRMPAGMADLKKKVDAGGVPTFEEAWEGLYRYQQGATKEKARVLYDQQLAQIEAQKKKQEK